MHTLKYYSRLVHLLVTAATLSLLFFTISNPVFAGKAAPINTKPQTIVLAGGCFWGIQGVFNHVKGVVSTTAGYSGGTPADPTYEQISTGDTGHAEAVKVIYDPNTVSLNTLLQVFFTVAHDPTELNFQGPDHGTQYRSAIFYTTDDQKKIVSDAITQLTTKKTFTKPIVTEIKPLNAFYTAEAYHQNYAEQHPYQPYIYFNDRPLIENLHRKFPMLWVEKK